MSLFKRKSDTPAPSPRSTPIEIKWRLRGSGNDQITAVGADNPDGMTDRDFAELVAKSHSMNWGDSDRTHNIEVKGWRKR